MAFWLILSLGSTAGLFFLLGADFVATAQLLVYVGGTLVLLIFGVMLTASGPFMSMKTAPGEGVMAAVIAAGLLFMILASAGSTNWDDVSRATIGKPVAEAEPSGHPGFNTAQEGTTSRSIGLALLGARPDKDLGASSGKLSVGYLLPFEIASVHLLVVLVGAAYLARAKRRVPSSIETVGGAGRLP
jgi:NADH:ubiquinone oxidoreductase subunit 6 (subunit J)